jgi:hypothetical protein
MRELSGTEIFEVGGGEGITFTTPVTMTLLNDVANATTVFRWLAGSFGAGYFVGTWMNQRFDISTKIVDLIS